MLPRKLIANHPFDVQEALNTRSFSEEVINAIWFIHDTVPQLNSLIKKVESLQTEKNIIASSFKGASAEERVALQKRGLEIKEAIDAKKGACVETINFA